MTPGRDAGRAGFALLPVVLALSLLAATAYLMTRESAMGNELLSATQRQDRARYVAEAALRHATWQAQTAACTGYGDVATTNFGADSYSATVTPTSGSPITVAASGTLADGTRYTLTRAAERVYETPTNVILQLSSDPGKDAILDSFYDVRNFGGASYLQVNSASGWIQRPLIQFDLPDIPAGVEVISARLELRQRSVAAPGRVSVHRVRRDWIEGTQAGGGQSDGADWPSFDGTNAWAAPGGEFDPAPASEVQVASATNGQWLGWEVGGLVEGWLSDPSSNHGMLLKEDGVVQEAEFASAEASDPNDAPKFTITYACECGRACGVVAPAYDVLLVVGDAAAVPLASKDSGRMALIESWGHTVTLIDDGATETDLANAAVDADVVYVSSTIGGGTLAHKLTGSIAPIVNEFPGKLDNFGFSSSTGASVSADTFSKSDAAHHITSPFGGDPIGVFTQSLSMSVPSGTLAPDLQNVAEVSGTAALVALEAGAQRWDGTPAPARRVHLPFGSAETAQLTADGETIMQRAIEWAAGAGAGGGGGGGPTVLTLTPSQDTMLRTSTTSVYGTDPDMRLNNDTTFDYRPLLQFDVSSIAPGTALTSATLRLYTYSVIETGAFTASAYKVTEEWAESWSGNGGAAWYERLKVGGGPSGTLDWLTSGGTFDPAWQSDTTFDPVAGEWVEWDLTPLVQEWVDGVSPNHGVLILPVTLGPYVNFLSKDWTTDPAQHPQLVVEYPAP